MTKGDESSKGLGIINILTMIIQNIDRAEDNMDRVKERLRKM